MSTRFFSAVSVLLVCNTMLTNADNYLSQAQLWVNAPHQEFVLFPSPLCASDVEPDLTGFVAEDSDDVPQFTDDPLFNCNRSADSITFYWWRVDNVGENGETVNPDDVTYEIWKVEEWGGMLYPDKLLFQGLTGTSFTCALSDIEGSDLWEQGEQRDNNFGLFPVNDAGRGKGLLTSFVIGEPYRLPYHESFTDQGTYHYIKCNDWRGSVKFSLTDETSSDGDGRCFKIDAEGGSNVTMKLGRMAITNDTSQLVISIHAKSESSSTLNPYVEAHARVPEWEVRHSETVPTNNNWTKYDLSTNGVITKLQSAEVSFTIVFERPSVLYIDDITIHEEKGYVEKGDCGDKKDDEEESVSLPGIQRESQAPHHRSLNLMGMPIKGGNRQAGIYMEDGQARFVVY